MWKDDEKKKPKVNMCLLIFYKRWKNSEKKSDEKREKEKYKKMEKNEKMIKNKVF